VHRILRLLAGLVIGIGVLAAGAAGARPEAGPRPPAGFWVAGDLHVHSTYGHDTCITATEAWDYESPDRSARRPCEDPYTLGFPPEQRLDDALARGLDFVAITDHNNVVNQQDPAVLAWVAAHPGFAVVPAYENSQPGHVQMLGARSCYGNAGAITDATVECARLVADTSAAGESALADGLRADGGAFQINHPSDGNWPSRFGYEVTPDTVEVWNIGPWAFQPPLPSSNDNDFSLRWYDGFLRGGAEVAITGGSDSHWVTTSSVQGIGEPTTWVFVKSLSVQGVLDGLRAHRTFVSALPPLLGGPTLLLSADRNDDGVFEAIAGSHTTPTATFRVRTTGALPGSVLRIVTDTGAVELALPATGTYAFRPGLDGVPAAATFVRAELLTRDAAAQRKLGCDPVVGTRTTVCRNDLVMEALTSPVYVD
jgi:hypothetical protein